MKKSIKVTELLTIVTILFLITGVTLADTTWTGSNTTGDASRTGNVGIGTTTPGQKLTIDGSSPIAEIRSGGYLMLRPTANDFDYRLKAFEYRLGIFSGFDLTNPIISFAHNGSVGIGITNPDVILHVKKSGSGTQELLRLDNPNLVNEDKGGKISFYETSDYETGKIENSWTTSDSSWNLILGPRGSLNAFTIKGNGNIGIGTTTPHEKIEILRDTPTIEETNFGLSILSGIAQTKLALGASSSGAFSVIQSLQNGYSWGNRPLILQPNGGNVGIGTTTPDSKLEVSGGRFKVGDGTNEVWIFGGSSGGLTAGHIGSVNNVPLAFFTNSSAPRMVISIDGNVGINTTTPGNYKLNVVGSVRANEVVVNTTGADYVFKDDYELRALEEVAAFIEKEKHLPGIPSASEMQANGVGVSEIQTKLLSKIEELTLYVIEQNKKVESQNNEIAEQNRKIKQLEKALAELK